MTALWIIVLCGALAVAFAIWAIQSVMSSDAGSARMQEISAAVREGAQAYLKRQYSTIAIVGIVIFLIVGYLLGWLVAVGFAIGAVLSGLAGFIGMNVSVRANVRTAQAAIGSLAAGLEIAFKAGAITGLLVAGLALLGVTLYFGFLAGTLGLAPNDRTVIDAIVALGFGGSLISIFARLGGGIFTKGADVGGDMVGKIEAGIPEDDPRNPATIADNVGDNVGDAAGMGSDVYESYIVTLLAAMLLGALVVPDTLKAIGGDKLTSMSLSVIGITVNPLVLYPILIGASGLIASIVGAMTVTPRKITDPMKPLDIAFVVSAAVAIVLNFIFTTAFLGFTPLAYSLFGATVLGTLLVPVIQKITDYYTNYKYKPVREIADSTKWGYASNTLTGIVSGMRSTGPFMISIVIVLGASYGIMYGITQSPVMGIYGTAMAATAMLSLAGIVLCIDAFGPISDNAGGIVEMTGMGEENRAITDKID